jgi:hypothetical protein
MARKPLTTEEVYFLVRVGSWDQVQLEAWVVERINESVFEEEYAEEYDEDLWDEKDE